MAILDDIMRQDIKKRIEKHITLQKGSFSKGNQYAFWRTILACEMYGISLPSWASEELIRISGELLKFNSGDGDYRSYGDYLAKEIFHLAGHDRRTAEAEQRNASIWYEAVRLISEGVCRKDVISSLEEKYRLDNREIQKLVDSANRSFLCSNTEE